MTGWKILGVYVAIAVVVGASWAAFVIGAKLGSH